MTTGAVTARQYARTGANVAIAARSANALEEVKASIVKETPEAQVLTFTVDVKDPATTERAVEETVKHFGKLDVLIANAGTCLPFEKREYLLHPHRTNDDDADLKDRHWRPRRPA